MASKAGAALLFKPRPRQSTSASNEFGAPRQTGDAKDEPPSVEEHDSSNQPLQSQRVIASESVGVRPCRLFMMGMCSAGAACPFRHDVPDAPGSASAMMTVEAVSDGEADVGHVD